jgi:LPS-assembly lipoprotein
MLLFELNSRKHMKLFAATALILSAALAGCQVRPLYSAGVATFSSDPSTGITSVSINEVSNRYGQEVRNQLIFALSGGAGEPANPGYRLELGISKRIITSVEVQTQTSGENQPTAGGVVLTSNYVLLDAATGAQIASGSRSVTASFDRSRQQFAQLRAERDAENRAARELAEVLKLVIAGELAKR